MHDLLGSDRLRQVRFDHVAAIETGCFRSCLFVGDELQRFSRALHPQPRRGFQSCDFGPYLLLRRAHFGLQIGRAVSVRASSSVTSFSDFPALSTRNHAAAFSRAILARTFFSAALTLALACSARY